MDYIAKMNEILAEKKKNGLVGIKFCVLPDDGNSAKDYQKMAEAFCKIEDLRKKNILKATASSAL